MKKSNILLLAVLAVILIAPAAFAAEGGKKDPAIAAVAMQYMAISCMVGLGLAASACGIAMGNAISSGLSAMARNPGVAQKLFPSMLIGLALIESLVIYTFVTVLCLLYANPLL